LENLNELFYVVIQIPKVFFILLKILISFATKELKKTLALLRSSLPAIDSLHYAVIRRDIAPAPLYYGYRCMAKKTCRFFCRNLYGQPLSWPKLALSHISFQFYKVKYHILKKADRMATKAYKYNWTRLKQHISDWKCHTRANRKNGNLHTRFLQKQEKGL